MFCKYRIVLSVDGAGIKGVVPLKILDFLHQSMLNLDEELDVTSWVDLFASTSASSIFTGALMLKDKNGRTIYKPKDILDFYLQRGTQIFSHTKEQITHEKHPLSFTLNRFFGKVNMLDFRNHFLFVCYNQTTDNLFSFSNLMDRYNDLSLAKVMNACSAMKDLYPSVKLGNIELCDAQFALQNPALMAYNHARMFYPKEHLILISIGTGEDKAINALTQQTLDVENQLKELSSDDPKLSYFRFQPKLASSFDSTNIDQKKMFELIDITEDYIFHHLDSFKELLHLMALKAA